MISFQNFSFRYEESQDFTLRGIDMTIQTGEFILLTGRSGCGKTTLIRSLNGLIPHYPRYSTIRGNFQIVAIYKDFKEISSDNLSLHDTVKVTKENRRL